MKEPQFTVLQCIAYKLSVRKAPDKPEPSSEPTVKPQSDNVPATTPIPPDYDRIDGGGGGSKSITTFSII